MITLYEVGGCVRDKLLGVKTKDIDFAVEAPSFTAMREHLQAEGYNIFVETPEYLTIRAHFPKDHPEHGRTTADFTLCRKERGSTDGRHPDEIEVGTLADDLARRDFTVNAMARHLDTGELIDLHGGQLDLEARSLRFVGDPIERIREDAIRVLRAVRFVVTKDFGLAIDTFNALRLPMAGEMLSDPSIVSTERVKDELEKCFRTDTVRTMRLLDQLSLFETLFSRKGIRLTTTMKG